MLALQKSAYPGDGFVMDISTPVAPGNLGRSGATLGSAVALIDADLAAMPEAGTQWLRWVLVNFGANDALSLPAQATWEANLAYYLDALHAKYPAAQIFVARPWRRGYGGECDDLADWIDNVLASRSAWAFVGPDERVYLENGDDGATYTLDGVHYNGPGSIVTAQQWLSLLGY